MLGLKCCVPASACFGTFPVFLKLLNWCKVTYQAVPGNYSDRKAVSKLVVCTEAWTSLPRQANVSPAKGGISKKSLAPLAVSQSVRPSDVRSSWRLWTGPKRQINWDPFLNSSSLQQNPMWVTPFRCAKNVCHVCQSPQLPPTTGAERRPPKLRFGTVFFCSWMLSCPMEGRLQRAQTICES